MKLRSGLFVLTTLAGTVTMADFVNFDAAASGKAPAGWTVGITGKAEPKWTVEKDDSAPSKTAVLRQSGEVPKASFPLCVKDESALKDGFVEVQFKSVSGEMDQAAGVIWRCADTNNYYICRANALEDNVVLYKVEQGKRTVLEIVGRPGGYGVEAIVAPQTWHTLRVEFEGSRFKVWLNGQLLFEVEDRTFPEAGRVGLWTKADSVMLFDNFNYRAK
jgi:hypothetical protein